MDIIETIHSMSNKYSVFPAQVGLASCTSFLFTDKLNNKINLFRQKSAERIINRITLFFYLTFMTVVTATSIAGASAVLRNPDIIGTEFPYHAYIPEFFPTLFRKLLSSVFVGWLALLIVSHDSFIMYLMNQICSQLQILELALQNLTLNQYKHAPIDELKNCIQHHQALILLRNRIEHIFTNMLLLQFLTSLSIIGMTGFQATVAQSVNGTQIVIYMYCVCILFELFLYCWFSNQVMEEVSHKTSKRIISVQIYHHK